MIGPFPEREFRELHRRLVLTLAPPNAEEPRHRILAEFFDCCGIAHSSDAAGNLIVPLGQGAWKDTVVLDAHIDVVERGGALEIRDDGECLHGLGVADDLAAVTVLALARLRLEKHVGRFPRPLVFLFSTGEEGLGNLRGVRQFVADHPTAPAAFLAFDGCRGSYSATALGSLRYRVQVETPGGHSWGSFGNPNAIELLIDYLAAVRASWRQATDNTDHASSYNFGSIRGGQGINSIARTAEATFEFRSVSPQVLEPLGQAVREEAKRLGEAAPACRFDVQLLGARPAGVSTRRRRLQPLIDALQADLAPPRQEVPMSTNINIPVAHGWPAVCLGLCQSANVHREDECVWLNSLPLGWQGLGRLLDVLLQDGWANPENEDA